MKTKVFAILPPRLGGLDMLLPLFLELKSTSDIYIEAIIVEESLSMQLERDVFLKDQTKKIIDKMTPLYSNTDKKQNYFVERILLIIRLILIISRILLSSNPLLMHSRGTSSKLVKLLVKFIRIKNGYEIGHFNLMDLYWGSGDQGIIDKSKDVGDLFLCFSEKNIKNWDIVSKKKCIPIGYTRLYGQWINEIQNFSKHYLEKEINDFVLDSQDLCVIYLPSTLKGVFDEIELEQWINEIIPSINIVFTNAIILVKPHPMMNVIKLNNIIADIPYNNCIISYLHPSILAAHSAVVISHHSSTIIDALSLNIPTIQHQNFSKHWLKRHPEGSNYIKLGHTWTNNRTDLIAELRNIKEGKWDMPDLVRNIGHKKQLSGIYDMIHA